MRRAQVRVKAGVRFAARWVLNSVVSVAGSQFATRWVANLSGSIRVSEIELTEVSQICNGVPFAVALR